MNTMHFPMNQVNTWPEQQFSRVDRAYYWSSFFILIIISGALSAINFFLTSNPYTAAHSGTITPDGVFVSLSMAINPLLLAIFALVATYIKVSGFTLRINAVSAAWAILAVSSGLVNGVLWQRPLTYIFDISSFMLIASLVLAENSKSLDESLELVLWFIVTVTLIGLALSIMRPNVWGVFQIGFSRDARGENVFGNLLGTAMLPALAIGLKNLPLRTRSFAFCVGVLSELSSGSRTVTFLAFAPLLIYLVFRRKGIIRIATLAVIIVIVTMVLISNKENILFREGGQISVEATLTGRYDLWTYYWQKFMSSPLFGHGVFLLNGARDYYSTATSEIGLLKVAAEYGGLAALVKLGVVMTAAVAAASAVIRADTKPYQLVLALYLLPAIPNFILQAQSRYERIADYIFWYSAFYFCSLAAPRLRGYLRI